MPRPREFDERRVLDAARDAFWSTGFAGTSMEDLTEATGLGKGSLYGAFGAKRDLFLRIFGEYCDRAAAGAGAALDGPPDGAMDRIAAYLHRAAAETAADVQRRGCLLAKGTAELSQHDDVVARRSRETFQAIEARLTAALAQAQGAGLATDAASPAALARAVLAAMRGIEALGKAGMGRDDLTGIADTTIAMLSAASR